MSKINAIAQLVVTNNYHLSNVIKNQEEIKKILKDIQENDNIQNEQ